MSGAETSRPNLQYHEIQGQYQNLGSSHWEYSNHAPEGQFQSGDFNTGMPFDQQDTFSAWDRNSNIGQNGLPALPPALDYARLNSPIYPTYDDRYGPPQVFTDFDPVNQYGDFGQIEPLQNRAQGQANDSAHQARSSPYFSYDDSHASQEHVHLNNSFVIDSSYHGNIDAVDAAFAAPALDLRSQSSSSSHPHNVSLDSRSHGGEDISSSSRRRNHGKGSAHAMLDREQRRGDYALQSSSDSDFSTLSDDDFLSKHSLHDHEIGMKHYYAEIDAAIEADLEGMKIGIVKNLPIFRSPREYTMPISPTFDYDNENKGAYDWLHPLQKQLIYDRIMSMRPYGKDSIRERINKLPFNVKMALDILSYDLERVEKSIQKLYPIEEERKRGTLSKHYMVGLTNSQRRQIIAKFAEDTGEKSDHLREVFSLSAYTPAMTSLIMNNTTVENQYMAHSNKGLISDPIRREGPWARGLSALQRSSLLFRMRSVTVNERKLKNIRACYGLFGQRKYLEDGYGMKMLRANDSDFEQSLEWLRSSRDRPSPI